VIEIAICIIHPTIYFGTHLVHKLNNFQVIFRYTQIGGSIRYPLDTFLFVWMQLRIYLIFRLLRSFSLFNYHYTDKFFEKENYGFRITYGLILKSLLKQRPYTMLCMSFLIVSIQLALAVRLFERPFYDDPKVENINSIDGNYQDYSLYNNSWWLIVVTMTTVGYGDYFPRTHLGRFIIILACFCGVFLVSLTIVSLTKTSDFSYGEKNAYEILHRLIQKKKEDKDKPKKTRLNEFKPEVIAERVNTKSMTEINLNEEKEDAKEETKVYIDFKKMRHEQEYQEYEEFAQRRHLHLDSKDSTERVLFFDNNLA
jgi:hypothetical protein